MIATRRARERRPPRSPLLTPRVRGMDTGANVNRVISEPGPADPDEMIYPPGHNGYGSPLLPKGIGPRDPEHASAYDTTRVHEAKAGELPVSDLPGDFHTVDRSAMRPANPVGVQRAIDPPTIAQLPSGRSVGVDTGHMRFARRLYAQAERYRPPLRWMPNRGLFVATRHALALTPQATPMPSSWLPTNVGALPSFSQTWPTPRPTVGRVAPTPWESQLATREG